MSGGKTETATPAFVPMAEGLGPEELYYCQVEAMLGTLLGRLLVVGLYCLVIAGWQGALIGMGLLLLLGWRQILRHKNRPDLLRHNRNRYIWAALALAFGPLLIRLGYALLQAWAPNMLDAWLEFTEPMVEYLGRHLPTFGEMRQMHSLLFGLQGSEKLPRLDLALHMQMLCWLSLPAAFLFAPLLALHIRPARLFTGKDYFRGIRNFLLAQFFTVAAIINILQLLGETTSFKMKALQFTIGTSFYVQVGGFLPMATTLLLYAAALTSILFPILLCPRKIQSFSTRFLRSPLNERAY